MKHREEIIGDCRLILGDCLEVMGQWPQCFRVNATIVDPPYGVEKAKNGVLKSGKIKSDYESPFDDTQENIQNVVVPAIQRCLEISERAAVTPGYINIYNYPKPKHVGTFSYPASCTPSSWGLALWQPILFYGSDPYPGRLLPDSKLNCNDSERNIDHPCVKPIKQWTWLVERASKPQETVFDPFMGSGTTGVVCAKRNRKFIGIEISPKYFDIACRRIEEAYKQGDLFVPAPVKHIQPDLLEGDA